MLLKSIKLAGFKSFADATTIPIRSHLCGIVGPNGCGKSNVIDAVRWVIGESSAKQLRGKSMADVIFNGAGLRQPMGQAQVELIFDNNESRLQGQYAQYAELSVRRQVQRNGQSSYFINNTPCRRRDVLDIFLGTGLGPRSYALIEQGMVARLIEAKPDELRSFLEEAAGVSKYKERRRDTENRMARTRENLDRVEDIQTELARQMRSLERQAQSAKRYQELSEQLRLQSAQLTALQWQHYATMETEFADSTRSLLTESEEMQTQLVHFETLLDELDIRYHEEQQQQQQAQKQYYTTGTEVARIEQTLAHQRLQTERWQKELAKYHLEADELQQQSVEYQQQMDGLSAQVSDLKPQKPSLEQSVVDAEEMLDNAQQTLENWQTTWEDVQAECARQQQAKQVNHTTYTHCENELQRLQLQQEHWLQAKQQLNGGDLKNKLQHQSQQLQQSELQTEQRQQSLQTLKQALETERLQLQQLQQQQQQQHTQRQVLEGRYASLKTLQEASLGLDNDVFETWKEGNLPKNRAYLTEYIQVDAGWEVAAERALGPYLAAMCCSNEDYATLVEQVKLPANSQLGFLKSDHGSGMTVTTSSMPLPSLANKVASKWPIKDFLSCFYVAENRQQAISNAQHLAAHESIITQEGDCFTAYSASLGSIEDPAKGRLSRQHELSSLQEEIASQDGMIEQLDDDLATAQQSRFDMQAEYDLGQAEYMKLHEDSSKLQAQVAMTTSAIEDINRQNEQAERQLITGEQQLQDYQSQLSKAETLREQAENDLSQAEMSKEQLQSKRDIYRNGLQQAQAALHYAQQKNDEFAIRLEANENQLAILTQTQTRDEKRKTALAAMCEELRENLQDKGNPHEEVEIELESLLQRRVIEEKQLQQLTDRSRELDDYRSQTQGQLKDVRRLLQSKQASIQERDLEKKEITIRQKTLLEKLTASGHNDVESILQQLPEGATVERWETELEQANQRIKRLGAINLAAIDELDEITQRHEYQSQQHADLVKSLSLLETAISKIDEETRQKFRVTFDSVNKNLQALFPKIFSGGRAYLELLDPSLTSSGIVIRAQPPGKRNTTIQMLSGGEKALTAIALVFAMFQLNPAPFCILDEVDAPLDDVNTGRYCELLKSMSKKIQYIVISHSKVTMSILNQLMGVTMPEPGVSRVVAVDMREAAALAE